MISTKNLISDLTEVPIEWVFEYYLNLKERLTGQNIKMLSAFNVKDKVPSMFIYQDSGKYKFKDFSSGFISKFPHLSIQQELDKSYLRIQALKKK